MAEKIFDQDFEGFWREINKSGLPTYSGVYVVQSCIYNKEESTVTLKKLIYIGKADKSIRHRVQEHEKLNDWKKELRTGEVLCYSCTEVNSIYNERVEAALINANKPIVNFEYKYSFPFNKTHVNSRGRYSKLKEQITVIRH
ncbi:GIY-YIG nuclease family protein [Mesoflavibacter zeaxanthinifaciens]|uniref:GIY-YIG nuclease family protein n=1 Tax=Mesoflavibacter zeaxanthinifaciens TaxID=393060 RepID=UPI003A929B38